ncbi:M1 family metallopeptidase [Synechococcus sp. PCC 7336]|uniref:M1 family metallopeptidase n=1 Tax=Synechococcus sp. PCC 7336 TaxID=195250 RepID=UPI00034A5581|nr:M1 family metallopeptidase [Synechococcus sp. PCC 7336]
MSLLNRLHALSSFGFDEDSKDGKPKPKPFARPGSSPHYTPDRPGRVEHIRLDLDIRLDAREIEGTCSIQLNPIRDGIRSLKLDAVDLEIQSVRCHHADLSFSYDGKELEIQLAEPTRRGERLELAIAYAARQPQRGIYFIHPSEDYPDKPVQVWTQGEDEDSRYWFPCFDYPGQLATTEILATVPDPYMAVSNGELVAVTESGAEKKTYHWSQAEVHPSYLVALAIGDFAELQDEWKGKPITYYVEKGREEQARITMGKTPEMVEFFSTAFGYPYAYPKYAQVCVDDFIFGGMENTSVTLLTDRCLLDERAAIDNTRAETLVAHELAHQWFGDLIVIKHWSHAWIKEGMATYSETLWLNHAYDKERADYNRYGDQKSYLSEDSSRYRRPMVTNVYKEAIELYDRHIYEKGACVYHMLRHRLGDDLFSQSIQSLITDHAHSTVDTADLVRAVDKATGINIQPLLDLYVFRGGHPDYKVGYSWDDDAKLAKVTVTQTQDKESLFDLKIPIAFGYDDGKTLKDFTVKVCEAEQSFFFPLPEKPQFISFDRGNHHLKTVELTYALPELKAQLLYASDVMARIYAAKAIAKKGNLEALKALQESLKAEAFWGVRVEVCEALADISLDQVFDVLASALEDGDAHVRRAAIAGLTKFKTRKTFDLLLQRLKDGDESYYFEGAVARAIGVIAGKTVDSDVREEEAIAALKSVLEEKAGWNEVVRSGAIGGLSQMKESAAALDLLLKYTESGVSQPLRLASIRALGSYASEKENSKVLERLRELSRETFFLTEVATVNALGQLNTTKAIPVLQSLESSDGRVERMVGEAIEKVQKNAGSDSAVKELRDELEQLKKTNRDLVSRLEKLETKSP